MGEFISVNSFKPTPLQDMTSVLTEIVPGAHIVQRPGVNGLSIEGHVRLEVNYEVLASVQDAKQAMVVLAEQFRTRALREFGLDPILEAQKREVAEYRAANRALNDRVTQQARRISDLEAALDKEQDDDDGS